MEPDTILFWLRSNWPLAVTWGGLAVLGPIAALLVSRRVSRTASQRAKRQGPVAEVLERIEAIEQAAIDYWTEGPRPGEPTVCRRSQRITRELARLEYDLTELNQSRHPVDYTDALIALRQAVTASPWQSASRLPLPSGDPRIQSIGERADALAAKVKDTFNAKRPPVAGR